MVDGTTTEATDPQDIWPDFVDKLPENIGITVIRNKADQTGEPLGICHVNQPTLIRLSAKTGQGSMPCVSTSRVHGFSGNQEGGFMARRRHLDALERAAEHLAIGQQQLEGYMAGEILAEELRIAQQHLNEITGEFSSDDLLGRIFHHSVLGNRVTL